MGRGRSPPPSTALPGREKRPSDSGRVPFLFLSFPYFSPLSCMHACVRACVHICLLVCQRPPDDRSGLGTWFMVMVYHWTDRRTDRRKRILRNTAFNCLLPLPRHTHTIHFIPAHTHTHHSYVTRIRALSSSACEYVRGRGPLGYMGMSVPGPSGARIKLQGKYWGISLRCRPVHGLFVTFMLRFEEVHLSIVRCPSHVAHQLGTYLHHPRKTSACPAHPYPIAPPSLPLRYMRTCSCTSWPHTTQPSFTPARKRPRDRPRGTLRGLVRDLIGLRVLVRCV